MGVDFSRGMLNQAYTRTGINTLAQMDLCHFCDAFADDIPELLRHRLQQGLLILLSRVDKVLGGISFNHEQTVPDVGLTAFLLSCLTKCYENEQISHPELRAKLLELGQSFNERFFDCDLKAVEAFLEAKLLKEL